MNQDALSKRWERYARSDAEFYIWVDVEKGDDFAASGERDAADILALCRPYLSRSGLAVEIGCGVGRLALPMSRQFDRVIGADIAPTMLRKLAQACERSAVYNVVGMLAHEGWDLEGPIDFAYSHIVLQHIEDWALIDGYFGRVARALGPEGVFYAQFDTRPPNTLYRLRNLLPDAVLPRNHRRGVRRIRRHLAEVEQLTKRRGFVIEQMLGAGSERTILILRRAAA
jgi:SAM-dependent methyltransferase